MKDPQVDRRRRDPNSFSSGGGQQKKIVVYSTTENWQIRAKGKERTQKKRENISIYLYGIYICYSFIPT